MLFYFFFFVFGTIIGSFLNVVVLRYGSHSFFSKRSFCGSCGKKLSWFELIPLVSFLIQRRRCRGCRSKISWQYPLVELITGLVFVSVFWKNTFLSSEIFFSSYSVIQLLVIGNDLLLWSLLISLSVYDLRHKIIPNALVFGFVSLSFLHLLVSYSIFHIPYSLSLFGTLLLPAPFALIWLLSKGRAMGLGDAKLMLGFSPFVGIVGGLSAILIGFWFGALVALAMLLLKSVAFFLPRTVAPHLREKLKYLTMKSELPLAPFLVLGLFIVYLTGIDVTGLGQLLAVSF